jgi:hypothetical protein
MPDKLPPLLETLRAAEAPSLRTVNVEGVIAMLTVPGIAKAAPQLEAAWADSASSAPFAAICLRLLARLAVVNSLTSQPVNSGFWQTVLASPHWRARNTAILACNMARDERLRDLLAGAAKSDPRGLNRALALEMLGTTVWGDPGRAAAALEIYRRAVAGDDPWSKLGALHGSLFLKEGAAVIPLKIIEGESNGRLVASSFAVLLRRSPARRKRICAAIVGYVERHRPSPRTTALLLGVCEMCDPAATRKLCQDLVSRPVPPRLESLSEGARYLMMRARTAGPRPAARLRRRESRSPLWPPVGPL